MDCPDPLCSGHGFCVEGDCICKKGWKGATCAKLDEEARQCLPDCSAHGMFDLETQRCQCSPGWTGDECQARKCNLDCGAHGRYRIQDYIICFPVIFIFKCYSDTGSFRNGFPIIGLVSYFLNFVQGNRFQVSESHFSFLSFANYPFYCLSTSC